MSLYDLGVLVPEIGVVSPTHQQILVQPPEITR